MNILVDLHAHDINDGLSSNSGGEGRWAQSWAKLLAENGHQVTCVCGGNVSYGSEPPVPNVTLTKQFPYGKYDLMLLGDCDEPRNVKERVTGADLYIYLNFSPHTIVSAPRGFYKPENKIIAYPVEIQFKYPDNPKNKYEEKSYFIPTPVAKEFMPPNVDISPSIAWTDRYGPTLNSDTYFNAFIKFTKSNNLSSKIFMRDNFYIHVRENEGPDGVKKLKDELNSLPSNEELPSLSLTQVHNVLKNIKFGLNVHGSGLGGSMFETVANGALPLPACGTRQVFPRIDKILYKNPYSSTIDEIIKNWEIPLHDREFYIKSLKLYQKEMEPHLYDNSLKQFKKVLSEYGLQL